MSTYGIIYVAYNTADLVSSSLTPWIKARREKLGGNSFVICAVSVPFEGFDHGDGETDNTRALLEAAVRVDQIDHVIMSDKAIKETDARGAALKWLMGEGVDTVWQADSDEFPTTDEITRTLAFVDANPFAAMFRGSLRNLVFTPNQWLAEPFTPPRIHRVRSGTYIAHSFWADNNILYRGTLTRDFRRDENLANLTIPKEIAFVRHETWVSNERSRRKERYQRARWGCCSFAWDEARGKLIWDEEYHRARGIPIPEVVTES